MKRIASFSYDANDNFGVANLISLFKLYNKYLCLKMHIVNSMQHEINNIYSGRTYLCAALLHI